PGEARVRRDSLKQIDLSGVAVTAEVASDGKLVPVAGVFPKLLRAAREQALPRIHTVVVAEGQRQEIERIDPELLGDDPGLDFRVVCAKSLADAIDTRRAPRADRLGAGERAPASARPRARAVARVLRPPGVVAFADRRETARTKGDLRPP
ncbi:MAG: hypothetical protein ACREQ9_27045, partial [Candidatus Binatia bacterium]